MKKLIQNLFTHLFYLLIRSYEKIAKHENVFPSDMDPEFESIFEKCSPYTLTGIERMYALYKSVNYILASNIEGDLVECGVWRGGSSMVIALTLLKSDVTDRKIYLYDTFEGMTEPTNRDVTVDKNNKVIDEWTRLHRGDYNEWVFSPLPEVKKNMLSTGYPKENIIFVKGKVEDTIPSKSPSKVALLRLDTDWYESTKHEMIHLFPLLVERGVLIVDDYGHWRGAKEAIDEYISENDIKILLNRVDYTGRIGIK